MDFWDLFIYVFLAFGILAFGILVSLHLIADSKATCIQEKQTAYDDGITCALKWAVALPPTGDANATNYNLWCPAQYEDYNKSNPRLI